MFSFFRRQKTKDDKTLKSGTNPKVPEDSKSSDKEKPTPSWSKNVENKSIIVPLKGSLEDKSKCQQINFPDIVSNNKNENNVSDNKGSNKNEMGGRVFDSIHTGVGPVDDNCIIGNIPDRTKSNFSILEDKFSLNKQHFSEPKYESQHINVIEGQKSFNGDRNLKENYGSKITGKTADVSNKNITIFETENKKILNTEKVITKREGSLPKTFVNIRKVETRHSSEPVNDNNRRDNSFIYIDDEHDSNLSNLGNILKSEFFKTEVENPNNFCLKDNFKNPGNTENDIFEQNIKFCGNCPNFKNVLDVGFSDLNCKSKLESSVSSSESFHEDQFGTAPSSPIDSRDLKENEVRSSKISKNRTPLSDNNGQNTGMDKSNLMETSKSNNIPYCVMKSIDSQLPERIIENDSSDKNKSSDGDEKIEKISSEKNENPINFTKVIPSEKCEPENDSPKHVGKPKNVDECEDKCQISGEKFEKTIFELKNPNTEKLLSTNITEQNPLLVISDVKPLELQIPRNLIRCHSIPQIQITDCSDSEGESDIVIIENSYDVLDSRLFPVILSDIEEDDEPYSDASDIEPDYETTKRNVVHQESKFQELVKNLRSEIEEKETENMHLKEKINDLEKDITADKVRLVESHIPEYRITELQFEIESLKNKINELEEQLEKNESGKNKLQNRTDELLAEKESKLKIIQKALKDIEDQKRALEAKFKDEYEKLRTVNSDREQQLLDDFEWKLREVEQSCKRKLEDKDISTQEKIKHIEQKFSDEVNNLKENLSELDKLRTYEAELVQLQGLTNEQQRSLRIATRSMEQLQLNEKSLNEEISRLRSSLEKERNHLATIQGIHSREISEKDRKHQFKLEQQRNELNTQWEDKLRRELTRLRLDLEKNSKEEKRTLLEELRTRNEKELKEINQTWEKKLFEAKKENDRLQHKIVEKEEANKAELLKIQTNSDRDMLELRRKIDKSDMSYQEQLEKKDELHERELEKIREDCEKRIQMSEQNLAHHLDASRTTLELVKEQFQREANERLEEVNTMHNQHLEEQYHKLVRGREEEISHIEEKHAQDIHKIQAHFEEELNALKFKENESLKKLERISHDLSEKTMYTDGLEKSMETLQNNIILLNDKNASLENLVKERQLSIKKQETEHSKMIFDLREHYEQEIQRLRSKLHTVEQQNSSDVNKTPDDELKSEECCSMSCTPTKSHRRKGGKSRNKGNKNLHNQRLLNKQFSSSSL